jgi:DNA-binding GntR family transcriptional regulator
MQLLSHAPQEMPVPIRRLTAAASICERLRDDIVALKLPPGSALQERDLTALFGVSRTPVREALIRLAEEGLVDIRPQSGTFVSRIPLGAIPEAVVVRQALEGTTAALAAASISEAGAQTLDAIVARQEAFARMDDRDSFHLWDEGFHEAIAGLSGHPGIWKVIRSAKLQIDRCRLLTLPATGRMMSVIAEHRTIVDAIKAGDGPAAQEAMQAHLHAVLPDATALSKTHPDFFV